MLTNLIEDPFWLAMFMAFGVLTGRTLIEAWGKSKIKKMREQEKVKIEPKPIIEVIEIEDKYYIRRNDGFDIEWFQPSVYDFGGERDYYNRNQAITGNRIIFNKDFDKTYNINKSVSLPSDIKKLSEKEMAIYLSKWILGDIQREEKEKRGREEKARKIAAQLEASELLKKATPVWSNKPDPWAVELEEYKQSVKDMSKLDATYTENILHLTPLLIDAVEKGDIDKEREVLAKFDHLFNNKEK